MMAKRSLYWMNLWLAACSLLLSTVILHHHHHFHQICFAEEICQKDGVVNDEHTQHHGQEQEGCRFHQMHQFVINSKLHQSILQHTFDREQTIVAYLSSPYFSIPVVGLVVAKGQSEACVLPEMWKHVVKRRGPPCLS